MQTERSDRGSQCSVSKWFIIRDSVFDGKMDCLFEFLHQEFADIEDNKTHSENEFLVSKETIVPVSYTHLSCRRS